MLMAAVSAPSPASGYNLDAHHAGTHPNVAAMAGAPLPRVPTPPASPAGSGSAPATKADAGAAPPPQAHMGSAAGPGLGCKKPEPASPTHGSADAGSGSDDTYGHGRLYRPAARFAPAVPPPRPAGSPPPLDLLAGSRSESGAATAALASASFATSVATFTQC